MWGTVVQHRKSTSSPPTWMNSSGKREATSRSTARATSKARLPDTSRASLSLALKGLARSPGSVGSTWVQLDTALGSPEIQLPVCAGMSISGTMRMESRAASSTRCRTSASVYVFPGPKDPLRASSGRDRSSRGKLTASVRCQCSTLSFAAAIAASTCSREATGRKCRAVSTRRPRQGNRGASSTWSSSARPEAVQESCWAAPSEPPLVSTSTPGAQDHSGGRPLRGGGSFARASNTCSSVSRPRLRPWRVEAERWLAAGGGASTKR
mmetsp:Transcript_99680/g.297780  ORF Transcript_99680/g.297780 Transcript_99680/m.297780 type:complete len:267 (+) Transcript_99680:839-1639(+)